MLAVNKIGSYSYYNSFGVVKNNLQSSNLSCNQSPEKNGLSSIPITTLHAYSNINFGSGLRVELIPPKGKKFVISKAIQKRFKAAQVKLIELSKDPDSWINLPTKLLKENTVDSVYEAIEKFKEPFKGKNPHLLYVTLGNSVSAKDSAKVLRLGRNVTYCCGTEKHIVKGAIMDTGEELDNIQALIVSYSGNTKETYETYKMILKEFKDYYITKGFEGEALKKQVAKHVLCFTDTDPTKTLRRAVNEEGFSSIACPKEPHSGFADLVYDMVLLAYVGLPKQEMIKILKAAEKMSKELLNNPLEQNLAGMMAAYDSFAWKKGAKREQFIIHDLTLDLSSKIKQSWQEHLRKDLSINIYREDAHNGLESAISNKLNKPKNITHIIADDEKKKPLTICLEEAHVKTTQKHGHYQKILKFKLDKENCRIDLDSFGEFCMLKSYLAAYIKELEHLTHDLYKVTFVDEYKGIADQLMTAKTASKINL